MLSLLQLIPPEIAHRATLLALKYGFAPQVTPSDASLQKTVFGKTFLNPIGLSAGADKAAEALRGWTCLGFGFVEAGTVTLHPRTGNPRPRLWRIGHHELINWLGLPGGGLAPFLKNLQYFHTTPERNRLVVGASIASPDHRLEEFSTLAAACAPWVDYITLNASCPNVTHAAAHDAFATTRTQIEATVQSAAPCPVLLKIGPTRDAESLKIMVTTALEAGAHGLVLTNTVAHDKSELLGPISWTWPEYQGKPVGGYSGPALLDTTCWMAEQARRLVGRDVPIIGVGGIQSGRAAQRVMQAGADLVQLYTGLVYRGPKLLEEIKKSLSPSLLAAAGS